MDLDAAIDALYQRPPAEFTAARNALAKTLSGRAARDVRALAKPTVPAWAVNQLFWRERALFDRVMEEGDRLRRAQIAALKGRASDVRAATEAHRAAIAAAVQRAMTLASAEHLHASADAIARTLDALSVAPDTATPGRLTRPLQPAGFEALAGVAIPGAAHTAPARARSAPTPPAPAPVDRSAHAPQPPRALHVVPSAAQRAAERRKAEADRKAAQRAEAARRAAETKKAAERRALERALDRAKREEDRARHALADAQKKVASAELRLRAL